jgi:2-keto-4-pentenoate hydratase/2-oxohepta-3-ene-1,7-dioic acid hydratase in catechol pathway
MSMRYVRFLHPSRKTTAYGSLTTDDSVTVLTGPPWLGGEATDESLPLQQVILQAPVEPSKIICIGLNYQEHVKHSQSADKAPEYPLTFMKPPTSVSGPEQHIIPPEQTERVDYEAELGVVISSRCRHVPESEAERYVFGLTCVNDVTARDLQKKDGQWTRAKGFDTFCPIGPWIVTGVDHTDLGVEGILNGKVMQSGRTSQMIFPIPKLIAYITSFTTLLPGDIISTGTPSGISPMKPGDTIEVKVENVGSLINSVAAPE